MKNFFHFVLGTILLSGVLIWTFLTDEEPKVQEVKADFQQKEIVQYKTERETHLYNKVEKTVDLPWFGDYQDLLASYAFNTCKKVLGNDSWTYSCENLVLTWNAENGWWRRDATNTANSNGTHDWWLCQLNSAYHAKFIKSKRFNNPLAQLDYCLQVRVDAKKKQRMPWYAFAVRHKRDKGIRFTQSNHWTVTIKPTENKRQKAKDQEERTKELYEQYVSSKQTELQFWKECVDEWVTCG
jgi:hypothetical protein